MSVKIIILIISIFLLAQAQPAEDEVVNYFYFNNLRNNGPDGQLVIKKNIILKHMQVNKKWITLKGYLTINDKRKLYYTFLTSIQGKADDPVVLWLNGGPVNK